MCLSSEGALIIKIGFSELRAKLASLLVTVIGKEVAEIITSFLTVLDINSRNGLSCCSYNM